MKNEVTKYPIDGILDLHTFHPRDVADVTEEYLRVCQIEGILRVRIIHGKGTGTLRRLVQDVLEQSPIVEVWHTSTDRSSWGATIVTLKNRTDSIRA